MGIVRNGIAQGFSGTVGELVFSQREGKGTVVRLRPKASSKPATSKQLAYRQVTTFCARFMRPFKEFVKIGFDFHAKREGINPYNAMVSELRSSALTGIQTGIAVDFSKLLVTKGEMGSPELAAVSLTDTGFAFSWDAEIKTDKEHYSDQVMLLAYFSELKTVRYMAAAAPRYVGMAVLLLEGIARGYTAEVYLSFCSDNRHRISNSVYLGQLTW